jgi:hypothetical protein
MSASVLVLLNLDCLGLCQLVEERMLHLLQDPCFGCSFQQAHKILEARKAIEKGAVPNQDLVSTISALAMEEGDNDLTQINQELLKRYSGNSNIS